METNNIQLNRCDEGRIFSLNISMECPRIIKQLIPTLSNINMAAFRRGVAINNISNNIHDFSFNELLPYIDDSWIEQTCKTIMNNPLIDSIFLSKKEVLRIHDFRMNDYNCIVRLTILVECEVSYQTLEMKHRKELQKSVDTFDLSIRTAHCLDKLGIEYIHELVKWSPDRLLKTKNFGRKSLNEVVELLAEIGLTLDMKIEETK